VEGDGEGKLETVDGESVFHGLTPDEHSFQAPGKGCPTCTWVVMIPTTP